jgi:outer membrane protein assembly factor BamB
MGSGTSFDIKRECTGCSTSCQRHSQPSEAADTATAGCEDRKSTWTFTWTSTWTTFSKLYALNPDGTQKWSYATGAEIHASTPAIGPDSTVYVGSYDGKLYAIGP